MQQINLYTAEFHPQRQWLTPRMCLQLWGAALAIGIVVATAQGWRHYRLSAEASLLQTQVSSEQSSFDADQAALAARLPSPALGAELERSKGEETAKNELLKALQNGVLSGQHGYTPVLVGLARNTIDGLWLTSIEIEGGDVNLKGETRKPDFVPAYIDKIVADSDFGPREYRSLKMETDDKGLLSFELRGHREKGDKQ